MSCSSFASALSVSVSAASLCACSVWRCATSAARASCCVSSSARRDCHTLAARCVAAHRLLQAGDRVVGGCLLGKSLELLRLQAVDARFQRAHIVFRSGQRCLILRSLAVDLCRFGLAFCQRSRVGLDICAHLCELLAILLCLRRPASPVALLGMLMPLSEQAQRFFVLLRFAQRIGVGRLCAFHGVTLPRQSLLRFCEGRLRLIEGGLRRQRFFVLRFQRIELGLFVIPRLQQLFCQISELELVALCLEPTIDAHLLRLLGEGIDALLELVKDVVETRHVVVRRFELALCFTLAVFIFADACRFLDEAAPLFGMQGEDLFDLALTDDAEAVLAEDRCP